MHELVDIGVNLASRAFHRDRDEVVERAVAAGVRRMVITGTSAVASTAAAELARARPGVLWATAGVHPHHAKDCDEDTLRHLRVLARRPEVVAVGECGLDFNRDFSPRPLQTRWFEAQLAMAAELGLPAFLHQRDAHERFMAILRPWREALTGAVVHCFTAGEAELRDYLDLDLHIGITGWLCDERRGSELQAVVGMVPPDRLLLETDSPYLLPRTLEHKPRKRRNEPAFLPEVLRVLAQRTGRTEAEVAATTTANATRLFSLAGAS